MLSYKKLIRGKKLIGCVIPHTHWDRAWYQPVEQFRLSLCRITKRVLDILEKDKSYRKFVFDGQTVVLEDFLELFPEEKVRVTKLIKSGKLAVGPFYVLPDFFIISGEAVIRNGIIGKDIAGSFGKSSNQGYVADPFGFPSQIPQIFSKLGIESLVFSRGVPLKDLNRSGTVFKWGGPDKKSSIIGIWQVNGYGNICSFGIPPSQNKILRSPADSKDINFEYSAKQITGVLDKWKTYKNKSKIIFLGNGVDHYGPTSRLAELVQYNRKKFPDMSLVICDCDEMLELINQEKAGLNTISGEFHEAHPGEWRVLEGTLETRPYLKQQFFDCSVMLERYSEPLLAMTSRLGLEPRMIHREIHMPAHAYSPDNNHLHPYYLNEKALAYSWKTLLRNSPHDDICGCSVDRTHRDAENRAERVMDITKLVTTDNMLRLARSIKIPRSSTAATILVFNPHGVERNEIVKRNLTVPGSTGTFKLLDYEGKEVACTIKTKATGKEFTIWNGDIFVPTGKKAYSVDIEFIAALPSAGYSSYFLSDDTQFLKAPPKVRTFKNGMENENLRVKINSNGTVNIFDKKNKQNYNGLNRLQDACDAGNEYLSVFISSGTFLAGKNSAKIELIEESGFKAVFRVTVTLKNVHLTYSEELKERTGPKKDLKVTFYYSLTSSANKLEVRAETDNIHEDHRLTVDFPTGIKSNKSICQSTFDSEVRKGSFHQAYCRDFVSVNGVNKRLTILSKALYSYDQRIEKGAVNISKCLLKASGTVSREYWKSPEGNSKRKIVQEYSILPGKPGVTLSELSREAALFTVPSYVEHFIEEDADILRTLPGKVSFVSVEGPLEISALNKNKTGGLCLRVINFSKRTENCSIKFSELLKVKKVFLTDMLGKREKEAKLADGRIKFKARPMEIVTLELV